MIKWKLNICRAHLMPLCVLSHFCHSDSAIPWTVSVQAPLSMGFSRQDYWSGLPFLPPGHLPDPGIKPRSPTLQADSLPSEPTGKLCWKVKVKSLSRVRLFVTPWYVACQAPPSMGFSRQEYWSGLPSPSSGYLPDPGIKPRSPTLEANSFLSELPGDTCYIKYM